MNSKKFS
ncbi:hypothetical protein B4U80_08543 [Leptotrombidium deliense]|nr:hypothetical protein B4U80_08543 [Leptotrombidium deliense]